MPRFETLVNFHMAAVKGQELDQPQGGNGGPHLVDIWTLVFSDRQTGDQIRISFREEARDELVRQLTGGIVLAGGNFPKV
jgi:hypothetical protein